MPANRPTSGAPRDGLRGLAGSAGFRVGVDAAMRARDVSRPRPEDLSEPPPRTSRNRRKPQSTGGSGGKAPEDS
jgi:hypothetical protein